MGGLDHAGALFYRTSPGLSLLSSESLKGLPTWSVVFSWGRLLPLSEAVVSR